MDANEKIYVKSYIAYTTEDVFLEGEVGETNFAWSSDDNPIRGRFDTIEDALDAVCCCADIQRTDDRNRTADTRLK